MHGPVYEFPTQICAHTITFYCTLTQYFPTVTVFFNYVILLSHKVMYFDTDMLVITVTIYVVICKPTTSFSSLKDIISSGYSIRRITFPFILMGYSQYLKNVIYIRLYYVWEETQTFFNLL